MVFARIQAPGSIVSCVCPFAELALIALVSIAVASSTRGEGSSTHMMVTSSIVGGGGGVVFVTCMRCVCTSNI